MPMWGMWFLPAVRSTLCLQKQCHAMIAITIYFQLEGVILNMGVVIVHPGLPGEKVVDHNLIL